MIEEAFNWNNVLAKLNKFYKEAYLAKHELLEQKSFTLE